MWFWWCFEWDPLSEEGCRACFGTELEQEFEAKAVDPNKLKTPSKDLARTLIPTFIICSARFAASWGLLSLIRPCRRACVGSLPTAAIVVAVVSFLLGLGIVALFVEAKAKECKGPDRSSSNLATLTELTTRKASAMFPAVRERRTAWDAASESEGVGEVHGNMPEVDTSSGEFDE